MKPMSSFHLNRTIVSLASAVILLSAGSVAAQVTTPGGKALPDSAQNAPPFQGGGDGGTPIGNNALLDGEYTYTGSATCVGAQAGFNPGTFQPNPGAFTVVNSFTVNGTRTFNGDGTGTLTLKSVSVNQFGASAVETVNAPFLYNVAPDLTITITSQPSLSTQTAGTAVGSTSILSNVPPMTGRITEDLSTIALSHPLPGIETITPTVGTPFYRICARERILHRVKRAQ